MNPRTTYILFGVLVGVGALLLIVLGLTSSKSDDTNFALPSLHRKEKPVKESDIDTVIVDRKEGGKSLRFKRDPDTGLWRMEEPFALPPARVDSGKVNELIKNIFDASPDKTSDVSGPLNKYGLDAPARTITLQKGDKEKWQLFLGQEERTSGGQTSIVYATSSDRKEPMAIGLNKLRMLDLGEYEYREQAALGPTDDVQQVKLTNTDKTVWLERNDATQWKFLQPNWGSAAWGESDPKALEADKKITGVKALLDVLAGFKVEVKTSTDSDGKRKVDHDFVGDNVEDLGKYGLTGDKLLRIQVWHTLKDRDGKALQDKDKKDRTFSETLILGKKDDKGDKVFAMLENLKTVFKVPAANIELLTKVLDNPVSLRNRDLISFPEANIDVVGLKTRDFDCQMFRTGFGDSWKLYRGDKADTADGSVIQSLLTELAQKSKIKDFPDESKYDDKATGLDQPAAVVSLWQSGIKKSADKPGDSDKKPELKDSTPTVKLSFGRRENGIVYVRRETKDTKMLVAVPDAIMDTLNRPVLVYLDKKLPSFPDNVTQLMLEREGSATFKAEKDSKGTWTLTEPADLKGRLANAETISNIIRDLRDLRASKILAEKAPEDLGPYGLKSPATTVKLTTVTKGSKPEDKDKTEEWTYIFSRDTNGMIDGKRSQSDLIFEVSAAVVGSLKGELRDTSLFNIPKSNVKTMTVRGWYDQFGEEQKLELKRDSSTLWEVKEATGAAASLKNQLDPAKAEELLNLVLRQRVEKFLDRKKLEAGQQPRLELKEDALWIDLGVAEGEAGSTKTYTLHIGGPYPSGGWFAESSVLGNDLFVLSATNAQLFDQIRKGAPPKFFRKATP